ncbi:DUF7344 domain-containing protein [Halosolutus halophilus]|uniref:DUF7344 domain-containing protein n=1 Tax=Halosolutus halophilus TaxID=1552990 RepID=UPI002235147E|nr:hypothetical protein [Halosolutus halophilus]
MNSAVDALLDLFQSERRRIVLELLYALQLEQDSDDVTVQVPDIVRQVAAREADVDSATVGRTVQRSSNVRLRHTHLPMLDDYGVIEYDATASEVSTTDRTRPVAQTMQSIVATVEEAEGGLVQSPDLDS